MMNSTPWTVRRIIALCVVFAILLGIPVTALAMEQPPGVPLEYLQQRVDELQSQLDALQAQVDIYTQCIAIEEVDGVATVVVECDLDVVYDLAVMGKTEHEGLTTNFDDTVMASDASVEGDTDLEDASIKGDATVVDATTLEGQLIMPDQVGVVDQEGVLVVNSSTATLIDFANETEKVLRYVMMEPAPVPGAELSIQFEVAGTVESCMPSITSPLSCTDSGTPLRNVVLKEGARPGGVTLPAGTMLTLRYYGSVWREMSRSGGHLKIFKTTNFQQLDPGESAAVSVGCDPVYGGLKGAVLLQGGTKPRPDLEIYLEHYDEIPISDDEVRYVYQAWVRNTGTASEVVTAWARCLAQ